MSLVDVINILKYFGYGGTEKDIYLSPKSKSQGMKMYVQGIVMLVYERAGGAA